MYFLKIILGNHRKIWKHFIRATKGQSIDLNWLNSQELRKNPLFLSSEIVKISWFSDVAIIYGPGTKNMSKTISDMKAEDIGSLVVCKAIVVRTGPVKP